MNKPEEKTIKVTNLRTRGNEPAFAPMVVQKSPKCALENLLIYEIGYGGHITDVSVTRIEVVTRIMGCIDTTVFEGSEADMKLLVEAAVVALQVLVAENENQEYKDKVADMVIKATKGNHLAIKLGAGMLMGDLSVKNVMICMLGDYGFMVELMRASVKDVFAVMMLVRTDGISTEDALSLI